MIKCLCGYDVCKACWTKPPMSKEDAKRKRV